jgi:hypothetical protein
MQAEIRDLLVADHMAGAREMVRLGAQVGSREPLYEIVRMITAVCIAQIQAAEEGI